MFESEPLHDAIVGNINVLWSEQVVEIALHAFAYKGIDAQPFTLRFEEVIDVVIPLKFPWGPSNSINEATHAEGVFSLEMQSGDLIKI